MTAKPTGVFCWGCKQFVPFVLKVTAGRYRCAACSKKEA